MTADFERGTRGELVSPIPTETINKGVAPQLRSATPISLVGYSNKRFILPSISGLSLIPLAIKARPLSPILPAS